MPYKFSQEFEIEIIVREQVFT